VKNTPAFDTDTASIIASEHYGLRASARPLPSEWDQIFLVTTDAGEKFVLRIANADELRAFIEAQNAVLGHVARKVTFCQSLMPTINGEEMTMVEAKGVTHFVRMVHYLPGVLLAETKSHSADLMHDLGRKLGQLAHALADFDHPAVHRDSEWDLANGNQIINEFAGLIEHDGLREVVVRCRFEIDPHLRRSVIHGDANDYNVLVDPQTNTICGLIDFGDMVYSYTVGELAIAIAYAILDKPDPVATAAEIVQGYTTEFDLLDDEREALWPLVRLRLAMSSCMAAYQLGLQPENEYLRISQRAIADTLPRI
jgi:Ser/Thr protein kinase RdoA (MazF antagonist)